MSTPANRPFSAGQVFDSQSVYARMRASMKPEAKMRGFFHYLAVQARSQARSESREPIFLAAKSRPLRVSHLGIAADDHAQDVALQMWTELADRFGGKRQLLVSFQLEDRPKMPTPCRAFILTPGVVERLCGAEAVRSPEAARKALQRLFSGQSNGDAFETARILAAVPELDGEVDETGFCQFCGVELPEQALIVASLPEQTTVVIVIDRTSHA